VAPSVLETKTPRPAGTGKQNQEFAVPVEPIAPNPDRAPSQQTPVSADCLACTLRRPGFFCDLSDSGLACLKQVGETRVFPEGKKLFVEDQQPEGVFMVCQGRVMLSMSAVDRTIVLLRVIRPGEILGVSSSLSGRPHEFSAEALECCHIHFIGRSDFLQFLQQHNEACMHVVRQLATKYSATCGRVRSLVLFRTAPARLAHVLLDSTAASEAGNPLVSAMLPLNRENLAAMGGTPRDTITRMLRKLQERRILAVDGGRIVVRDRDALRLLLELPFSLDVVSLTDSKDEESEDAASDEPRQ
jgi:CRP/FNR family cyclic AMP-dependent transcriptional regulator